MLKQDLILAARILVRHGLTSGPFGNISIRQAGDANRYWINPNGVYFDDVEADELVEASLDEGGAGAHVGDCIHRAIYRRRPDARAIVHVHSSATVLASLLDGELEPYTQIGAAFHGDQGVYRGFEGPVRDPREGAAIAEALGPRSIVIARRHGIFAVGASLMAALWDMMLIDWAAREQLEARKLGLAHAEPVTPELVAKSRRELRELGHPAIWKSELRRLRKTDPGLFERLGL